MKTLSDACFLLNDNDNCLRYLLETLTFTKELKKPQGIFECLSSFGKVLAKQDNFIQAEEALLEAKTITEGHAFSDFVLYDIGEFYFNRGKYSKAIVYLSDAEKINAENHASNTLRKIYLLRSKIAEQLHEPMQELFYIKKHNEYNSIYQQEEYARNIRNVSIRFEINKTKKENKELQHSLEILKSISEIGLNITSSLQPEEILSIVNDSYGYQAGDELLKQISARLLSAIRSSDLLVRWGGEEFLLMARETNINGAKVLADKILHCIADVPFELQDVKLIKTVSIGFSLFPVFPDKPKAVSWEHCINLADKALYKAKASGRNTAVGFIVNKEFK